MNPSHSKTDQHDPQPWALDSKTQRAEGQRRRDEAHLLLKACREGYLREGRRALLLRLLENGTATADDVRVVVKLPEGMNPTVFGAVPPPLARAGIIRSEGFTKTYRPEGHARPITVWRLVDGPAAEQWLADHPQFTELTTATELVTDKSKAPTALFAEEQAAETSTDSNPNL